METDYGSEFRYRKPLIPEGSVACSITQSGETADTLAAMREARERGAQLWTICNVVGSMAARLAEGVLYTQAGPEIGVASTKAFTSQLTCLYLLALRLAELRDLLDPESMAERLTALAQVPGHIESILSREPEIAAISRRLSDFAHFIYLGRGPLYPIALEGAFEAERDFIHPRARLSGRRDEAWSDRPDRSPGARGLLVASRPVVREGLQQHAGSQSAGWFHGLCRFRRRRPYRGASRRGLVDSTVPPRS